MSKNSPSAYLHRIPFPDSRAGLRQMGPPYSLPSFPQSAQIIDWIDSSVCLLIDAMYFCRFSLWWLFLSVLVWRYAFWQFNLKVIPNSVTDNRRFAITCKTMQCKPQSKREHWVCKYQSLAMLVSISFACGSWGLFFVQQLMRQTYVRALFSAYSPKHGHPVLIFASMNNRHRRIWQEVD